MALAIQMLQHRPSRQSSQVALEAVDLWWLRMAWDSREMARPAVSSSVMLGLEMKRSERYLSIPS